MNSRKYSSERPVSSNINKETGNICRIINQAANNSTSMKLNNITPVPWCNKNLQNLKKIKNREWKTFNKNMPKTHLINYERANALLKREIKCTKNASTQTIINKSII